MDIETAFRVGAAQELNPEDGAWVDEITLDILRSSSEEESLQLNEAAVRVVQEITRTAFFAGRLYQAENAEPQYDTPASVEEKFALISNFMDLIRDNRTGE